MNYADRINDLLKPQPHGPLVLDLFAGCGGLALGLEACGFETHGFEVDSDACATYRRNLLGECSNVRLNLDTAFPSATVIVGGPPCQPYSVAGHQHGLRDSRDGFPIFIRAVEQVQPEIFLIENVRGMMYRNRPYLDEIVATLRDLDYVVEEPTLLNAVDFGVPQNRERVIIVGHRGHFEWPARSAVRLAVGEALTGVPESEDSAPRFLTASMDRYIANYERKSNCVRPRDLHMERPARTLTCRNLGGATADMMRIRLADGRRRRLTLREAARIQSFPDWFEFCGGEGAQFKQVGNSVAPLFAWALAGAVRNYLQSDRRLTPKEVRSVNRQMPAQLPLIPVGLPTHAEA